MTACSPGASIPTIGVPVPKGSERSEAKGRELAFGGRPPVSRTVPPHPWCPLRDGSERSEAVGPAPASSLSAVIGSGLSANPPSPATGLLPAERSERSEAVGTDALGRQALGRAPAVECR